MADRLQQQQGAQQSYRRDRIHYRITNSHDWSGNELQTIYGSMMEFVVAARKQLINPLLKLEYCEGNRHPDDPECWREMDGWEFCNGLWGWMNSGFPKLMPKSTKGLQHTVVEKVVEKVEELARKHCAGCIFESFASQKRNLNGCLADMDVKLDRYYDSALEAARVDIGFLKTHEMLPRIRPCFSPDYYGRDVERVIRLEIEANYE